MEGPRPLHKNRKNSTGNKFTLAVVFKKQTGEIGFFLFYLSCSLEIVRSRFKDYAVKKQDFLGNEDKNKKVLQLVPDENILL
ncbi:hypothetical protein DPMN_161346 [Dreissena polymorpha]|uniref:Uncharacterized protein n=1 Tax=Dreissena polymorpha TaxID=45954 RepID=A0A9D4ISI8_DREPO|nr:hypothetical protein DPMN_161346 [Dreissena polymorpha]